MAVLDERTRKIVVRIVFDGPARAGKSTNLKQLCQFLTPLRRSELFVPEEVSGRTLFFDWLQMEGGVVAGYHLRCQFVTVPGQAVLSRRRKFLLRPADALVFVCESTREGLEAGREHLSSLHGFYRDQGIEVPPLVIQANKQDLVGAVSPERARSTLGLPEEVPSVGAHAEQGSGIRETVVLAIRAAANRVQEKLLALGPESMKGDAETAEELHQSMLEVEIAAPQSPIEALLHAMPGGEEREVAEPFGGGATEIDPAFPDAEAPSGCIWPTPLGREILRSLAGEPLTKRDDLVGRHGSDDGSGKTDSLIYAAGPWCLKTSSRRRFEKLPEARSALVDLARAKGRLGEMLAPNTVLALGTDGRSSHWLWTVTPWYTTLRAEMADSDARADDDALGLALEAFARAAVQALALAVRSGVALDVHPSNLVRFAGRTLYIDDDIGSARAIPAIGYNLLQRVEEYSHRLAATEKYLAAVEEAIGTGLTREEMERLELESNIERAVVRTDAARGAQRRWTDSLRRSSFAKRDSRRA
jgi:hypothetical protein